MIGPLQTPRYLFWLTSDLVQFRMPEFRAVFDTVKLTHHSWRDALVLNNFPFLVLQLDCEAVALKVAERATAVHAVYRLWSQAASRAQLHSQLRQLCRHSPLSGIDTGVSGSSSQSFKIVVDSHRHTVSNRARLQLINRLSYLPLAGPVALKDPQLKLAYLEQYDGGELPFNTEEQQQQEQQHENEQEEDEQQQQQEEGCVCDDASCARKPCAVYFGRWLSDGNRRLISEHSLKQRIYIGNTSLQPELALIMANLAGVRPGSLVLDPFVGTGSTLVGAAALGAHTLGADIDYLTVHARTRATRAQWGRGRRRHSGESVAANFEQYGLGGRLVDVLVADAALSARMWRDALRFDAIVADPPYGLRESNQRLGPQAPRPPATLSGDSSSSCSSCSSSAAEPSVVSSLPTRLPANHLPTKTGYSPDQLYCDLLQLAAERLLLAGRLVVWLPSLVRDYSDDQLPRHNCLRLLYNCEQRLTRLVARRLLVYEKWREPLPPTASSPSSSAGAAADAAAETNGAADDGVTDLDRDEFNRRYRQVRREVYRPKLDTEKA